MKREIKENKTMDKGVTLGGSSKQQHKQKDDAEKKKEGTAVAKKNDVSILCWRSWAALGAYVGGLGPKNAKNMATRKMYLFLERERDLRPGGRS